MMEKSYQHPELSERLRRITEQVQEQALRYNRNPKDIKLMAVTKTRTVDEVNAIIDFGVHLLGENKVQELVDKYDGYHKENADIHFIGHLQTNKVKYICDKVSMIHSVDSEKLASEIDKQSAKIGKRMDILLEVNIGKEESKSGVFPEKLEELVEQVRPYKHLHMRGLMAIPPAQSGDCEIEQYFDQMHQMFIDIRDKNIDNVTIDCLSMGMSQDYLLAIKHGSNIIRLGTAIFGPRDYGNR